MSAMAGNKMAWLTSALWRATLKDKNRTANKLIICGANVNEPRNTADDIFTTLLHYATKKKDVQRMRLLIKHGANCDARDSQNRTPLHWAAKFGDHPDVLELLISEGADVEARDNFHLTPFLLAVLYQRHESAEMLIARGASIEAVNHRDLSALHIAVMITDLRMIKILISHKMNVNVMAHWGFAPLHFVSHPDIACLLLDNGADVNKKTSAGYSPLYFAANANYSAAVHLLLKRGALINEANDVGNTALHGACKRGSEDAAAILIEFGADMHALNSEGKMALQLLLPNEPSTEVIARIIIREVIKREALGQPICEGYKQTVESCEKYSKIDQKCREEFKRMRSEMLDVEDSAVSFFYIFSKNEAKLAALARNKNIVTAFETSDYLALFSIYAVDLTKKFEKAKLRANFLINVEDCLNDVLGDMLPAPILQKMAAYVEYVDD